MGLVTHTQKTLGARFSEKHEFRKPNDRRALDLMNDAARNTLKEIPEITLAYGVSDEYRCVVLDVLLYYYGAAAALALQNQKV